MTQPQLIVSRVKDLPVTQSVRFDGCNSFRTLFSNTFIYKSTLSYSAALKECETVLEKTSGLKCNEDFFVGGYLPANIKVTKTLNLGITFMDNCPEQCNTKASDVINLSYNYGTEVGIHNHYANPDDVMHKYSLKTRNQLPETKFDTIILTIAHNEFLNLNLKNAYKTQWYSA